MCPSGERKAQPALDTEQGDQCFKPVRQITQVRISPACGIHLVAGHRVDKHAGAPSSRSNDIVVSRPQHQDCRRCPLADLLDVVRIVLCETAAEDPFIEKQAGSGMWVDRRQSHDRPVASHQVTIELGCRQLLCRDLAGECQPPNRRAQTLVLRLPCGDAILTLPGIQDGCCDLPHGLGFARLDQLAAGVAAARLALTTASHG